VEFSLLNSHYGEGIYGFAGDGEIGGQGLIVRITWLIEFERS